MVLSTASKKIRYITVTAMLAVIMYVSQIAIAAIPNIELVSLLVIVYTAVLGIKSFPIIGVFIIIEGLTYGFGLWWMCYTYIWFILAIITLLLRGMKSSVGWAFVSGVYGLFFGLLCSIVYFFTGGASAMFAFWIGGIKFDIAHCIGNFVIALLLFKPLYYLLDKLYKKIMH